MLKSLIASDKGVGGKRSLDRDQGKGGRVSHATMDGVSAHSISRTVD